MLLRSGQLAVISRPGAEPERIIAGCRVFEALVDSLPQRLRFGARHDLFQRGAIEFSRIQLWLHFFFIVVVIIAVKVFFKIGGIQVRERLVFMQFLPRLRVMQIVRVNGLGLIRIG